MFYPRQAAIDHKLLNNLIMAARHHNPELSVCP